MELMEAVSLKPMDTFLLAQINRGRGGETIPRGWKGIFFTAGTSLMLPPTCDQPSHSHKQEGLAEPCPRDLASHCLLFPRRMISTLTILFLLLPKSSLLLPVAPIPLHKLLIDQAELPGLETVAALSPWRWLSPEMP